MVSTLFCLFGCKYTGNIMFGVTKIHFFSFQNWKCDDNPISSLYLSLEWLLLSIEWMKFSFTFSYHFHLSVCIDHFVFNQSIYLFVDVLNEWFSRLFIVPYRISSTFIYPVCVCLYKYRTNAVSFLIEKSKAKRKRNPLAFDNLVAAGILFSFFFIFSLDLAKKMDQTHLCPLFVGHLILSFKFDIVHYISTFIASINSSISATLQIERLIIIIIIIIMMVMIMIFVFYF